MNGQIQYGSARPLTLQPTRLRRPAPSADPARFPEANGASRAVTILFGASILTGGLLLAAPTGMSHIVLSVAVGGGWLSLVLAMTLPRRPERAGQELLRRLAQFRHELNTLGDAPSRETLEQLVARASELGLEEPEVGEELAQIRASIDAYDLKEALARGEVPEAVAPDPLPPGDTCHFVCPVRFGRRRSDQFGHLVLTAGWLKFRGALDVSLAWSEVASLRRDGRDLVVAVQESRRVLRFSCHSFGEAARGGVIAEYLLRSSRPDSRPPTTAYHASF